MAGKKEPSRKDAMPLDFAKLQKLVVTDLKTRPYQPKSRYIGKYTKKDIVNYLLAPEIWYNQVQLRYISKYLYNVSNHYKRLVQYFSSMLTFDHVVEPYGLGDPSTINKDKFKKAYFKSVDLVESMNLKHEFQKVLNVAFREDVYFGYVFMGKDSFFLQRLDPDYCQISSEEDGVYNFAFNFMYFNAYPYRLDFFPQEFKDKYKQFCTDGVYWRELDSTKSICIKINEDLDFPIPPFVGVLGNLLDFEDFKDLRKIRTEIGNYKLIWQKIPIRNDSEENNDYMITYDQALVFHNNVDAVIPDQIGLATTPMELDVIDFERDRPDINKISDIEAEYWNSAGVSQLLFTGDSGSIGLTASIRTDEMIAFTALRQLERWTNRFLKNLNGQFKFRVKMLNTTYQNQQDVINMFLDLAQNGMGAKTYLLVSAGISQSAMTSMTFLENDVLELHENLIPLQTSHTMNGENEVGGQKKDASKLSDSGLKTRDKNKNQNRAKK